MYVNVMKYTTSWWYLIKHIKRIIEVKERIGTSDGQKLNTIVLNAIAQKLTS